MRGPGHKRNTRVCIGRCDTEQVLRRAGPRATFTPTRVRTPCVPDLVRLSVFERRLISPVQLARREKSRRG